MTDIQEWERRLQEELAGVRRSGRLLARTVADVRGRGETRGVAVEVDAAGEITNLQIAPAAMRWTSIQLATAILECHRRARAEARSKVERLVRKSDTRIRNQFEQIHSGQDSPKSGNRASRGSDRNRR